MAGTDVIYILPFFPKADNVSDIDIALQVSDARLVGNFPDVMNCFLKYSYQPRVHVDGWQETLAILHNHADELAQIVGVANVSAPTGNAR